MIQMRKFSGPQLRIKLFTYFTQRTKTLVTLCGHFGYCIQLILRLPSETLNLHYLINSSFIHSKVEMAPDLREHADQKERTKKNTHR